MHIAASLRTSTGAALVGAGLVAISAATAMPRSEFHAVALTTVESPFSTLTEILQAAFGPTATAGHDVYADLAAVLPGIADIQSLYQFGESAASGVLLGEVGTVLSPILALDNGLQTVADDLTGAVPDPTAAFTELADIPAIVTNAFLNGYGDLNLAPLIAALGPVATDHSVTGDLPLGGLLSPAGTFDTALHLTLGYSSCVYGPDTGMCVSSEAFQPGSQVGPVASLEALLQNVEHALGFTGTTAALPDLGTLSGGELSADLANLLGSDLSTALANLPTEFSTLTTDVLTGLL